MSISGISAIFFGLLFYLFFAWKKLKEDYRSETIFAFLFFVLIVLALFVGFGRFLFHLGSYWFWSAVSGSLIGFLIGVWRFKVKFFEAFEAVFMGLLNLLGLYIFEDALRNQSFTSLGLSIFILSLFFFFFFLEGKYKEFAWYRSGRVGFSGLFSLGLFFVLRSLVASFYPYVISFSGSFDAIISAIAAFTCFLMLYNLARS